MEVAAEAGRGFLDSAAGRAYATKVAFAVPARWGLRESVKNSYARGMTEGRLIQSDVIICVKSFLNEALCGTLIPAAVNRDSSERSRGKPGSHNAAIRILG